MLLQGGRNFLPLTALLLDDNRYSWTFISALFSSPFLSILIHGDNQIRNQILPPQIRHVPLHRPPGKSAYPGPHLAGFFPGSSRSSLRTRPPHPLVPAPAPPTADQRREGSASEAIGEPSQGPPGVQDLRRVWSQARRGRNAAFLASESPDSRLPHENQRAASKPALRLSEGLRGCSSPVFLPGESQGRGSLVGCRLWGRRVGHN